MSKPKGFEKPTGVKDYLPEDVAKLKHIEFRVLHCMEQWGYRQMITPTLEFYDTVGLASATMDRKLFKLLDRNGRTLVLRSDITAPIARIVASPLSDEALPMRISYHANVFRAFEEEAGRESEFFQTGVELVGDSSADADAEIIALAIASLKAAGVKSFKIAIGHAGFLNGLLNEKLPEQTEGQNALKECLLHRDYVGYHDQLHKLKVDAAVKAELESLVRLRGNETVYERALAMTKDAGAIESLQHLQNICEVLKAYDVEEHLLIDLSAVGDLAYYTGMTFEGYAAGLGFPVCSGGRYDNLLAQFGRPAPATGFALKTNRIMEVVSEAAERSNVRVLVLYDVEHRQEALRQAIQLRAEQPSYQVETQLMTKGVPALTHNQDGSCNYNGRVFEKAIVLAGGGQGE